MTTADERAARLEQAIHLKRAAARSIGRRLPSRPADEAPRLGEMQRSLWLSHQMDPLSPVYNLVNAFRVRGPLDLDRLRRALGAVLARHRLLRSTFRFERDVVLQVIGLEAAAEVPRIEVPRGEALAAAVEEARRPFDLERGPLVRMRLIEEAGGRERLLLLVLHHILADERSLTLTWEELAAAYEERLSMTPPEIQFDDFVAWSRRSEEKGHPEELDYWRRRLDPLPSDLRLPFESSGGPRGRLLSRSTHPELLDGVRGLAAATGATPFTVCAFAFRLLLDRYTGGERVAFATPVSTRSHPATAKMIGYFLNPVLVLDPIDEEAGVGQAVREFSGRLRESMAHASLPFQTLAEELSPARQPDRHPLFQTMFVHQESAPPPALGEARLEPLALDLGESKFDLSLFVNEGEKSLELAVEYRADRLGEAQMRRLLDHYETLLERLPEDLENPTTRVSMLGESEAEQLRAAAQGAAPETERMALLPWEILDRARRSPEQPAVVCGEARWSYGELAGVADEVATRLRRGGVEPGDRVGVFLERSARMIAGILGSHWAGAAYVPLDPKYPQARNRQVLEDAEVAAVLTTGSLHGRLPVGNWAVIDVEELNPTQPAAVEPAETLPGSVAYVLYTSGSTGRPKGVVVSHENLRISTAARLQVYDRPPGRFLLLPSIAFDSSVAGIFWTLATGGALVIPNDEEVLDPRRLTRLLAEEDVSSLLCVPSLYSALLAAAADPAPALEVAIVAGESCPGSLVEEHFRRLPRVRLFNEYGPTEATVWATVHEVGEQDARRPVAIGRPIPGVRVEVLDSNGHPVPAGVPGEAWISGPTVAQGYWRRPELTEECFVPQTDGGEGRRRYRSGDQMAWTLDGRLRFLGRVDEQIKVRGFRIEPGEIEAALGKLPGVGLAAVVARSLDPAAAGDVPAGELVAFVQGSGVGKGWRRELARRLPGQMVPSRLVELTELPRLPNGKIDRQRLSRMPLAAEAGGEPEGSPASDLERSLISLWQALLGVSRIGPDDNFFELGGHSLLVFEMTLALERDLGTSLPPAEVFASPTVRQLARRIGRRVESRSPFRHLFPIQPIGRRIPFIVAIPHFFTDMFAARFRSERPVYGLRGVGLRPEGNLGRWPTMRELGEELVDEIARRFPNESCILAGYSFGASMAVETVRLMEERGLPVHRLYLIAPMPLDVYRLGPLRLQLDDLRRPIGELSVGEALRLYARSNKPWMRRLYGRIWRRLGIEPWRRLHCLAGRLRRWAGLPLTPGMQYADVRVDRFRLHVRYRPRPVHTPTVFFNAREPATDAAATWRPWFQGPFTVRPIPDPHLEDGSIEEARRLILEELQELGDEPC